MFLVFMFLRFLNGLKENAINVLFQKLMEEMKIMRGRRGESPSKIAGPLERAGPLQFRMCGRTSSACYATAKPVFRFANNHGNMLDHSSERLECSSMQDKVLSGRHSNLNFKYL